MKAAIITPGRDITEIIDLLFEIDPQFKPEVWPDVKDPSQITGALVWRASAEILSKFNHLQLICSFGAGVDHLLNNPAIPSSVTITRLVDPALADSVAKYCIMAIVAYEKNFKEHILNQSSRVWGWKEDKHKPSIGVLGMGVIGKNIALKLFELGYEVSGYSLNPKKNEGIPHFHGMERLPDFLASSDILVNIMPLTEQTRGFFNKQLFNQCNPGTYLINLGRGPHVVDDDLISAMEAGILSGATLDVFNEEPLPAMHPFWKNEKITITPHIAGLTTPKSAAAQFYENFKRLKEGRPLLNEVDRSIGY